MDFLQLNPVGLLSKVFAAPRRPERYGIDPARFERESPSTPSIWEFYRNKVQITRERLEAYRDYCLTEDTKISLLNGTEKTIGELFDLDGDIWVYSYDLKTRKVVPGKVIRLYKTGINRPIVKVTLDNGESIRCTPNHPFLFKEGEYRRADQLQAGDSLMPIGSGYLQPTNHKVISVEPAGLADIYNITVDKYHNFALSAGVFVKNTEMDFDDLVSAVLDAMAEDCTQPDMISGRIVWISSENQDVVKLLTKLFDKLEIEDRVASIIREAAKYGDCFLRNWYRRGEGIIALEYYEPQRVFRVEEKGRMRGFTIDSTLEMRSESILYNPWDFIHFFRAIGRLRPDQTYGDSLCRPARRLWRKLQMVEDSIIMYRLKMAPDRFIFYVDCGEASASESVEILRMWRRALKKQVLYQPDQGRLRVDYNPWCLTPNTIVPLVDGRNLTLQQILDEYGTNRSFSVYSFDKRNNCIVEGEATHLGVVGTGCPVYRVTLDDGSFYDCTSNHEWILKGGVKRKAIGLQPGDSFESWPAGVDHKVVSVEYLGVVAEVHCLSVVGYHNFAVRCERGGEVSEVFTGNSVDQDFFWPTKEGSNSRIEKQAGSANIGEIHDYELLVKRLFAALRAPPSYFGMKEEGGAVIDNGKTLGRQDIRWARSGKAGQKAATRGLVRLCQVHMALKGIDPTDPANEFEVCMAPISYLDEMERLEVFDLRSRAIDSISRVLTDVEGLDKKRWVSWLLWKFGGLSKNFLDQFIDQNAPLQLPKQGAPPPEEGEPVPGVPGMEGEPLTPTEEETLITALGPEFLSQVKLLAESVDQNTRSSAVNELLPAME
jgi:hypothetical protein